ncbi:hypothetical protein HYW87_03440, partial [Candidatus Roizmanbacteria bacterium]|nr:hypothetical protein [Candidatus Roizmanbacteria bacterium]
MKHKTSNTIVSYSAPAKVILSGEHAAVYSKPALVSAIDLRLTCSITEHEGSSKKINTSKEISLISDKVRSYLKKQKDHFHDKKFSCMIKSAVPLARGLGSSAALSVATAAAFLEFYTGKEFEKEKINNLAYEIEKHFHKIPSGLDVSASCFGGLIYFRKEFEFLKNISSLNFKITKNIEDRLYLIDSGRPRESTAEMINLVGKRLNQKYRFVEQILNDVEKVTKRIVVSLVKEDTKFFMQSIVNNQVLLEMLGVVSIKTKKL